MARFQPPPQNLEPIVDEFGRPTVHMIGWINAINDLLNKGFTGTVVTAKLTGGGTNGSMEFRNGVLITEIDAT